jgi:hypothetical protein
MMSNINPPKVGETPTKINFDTETTYKIGKTTYLVTSHFTEDGEPTKTRILRLLKKSLTFELCGNLTRLDK